MGRALLDEELKRRVHDRLPVLLCVSLLFLLLPVADSAATKLQLMRSVEVMTVDDSGNSIRFPSGISYDRDGDELYVTSPQRNKLIVFTPDYFPYLSIGSGRGLNSISKTYIKHGLLYVCVGPNSNEARPHIAVFDMAFMPVKQIYFPDYEFFSPLDLVVAENGCLYVIGMGGTGVMVLDADGNFLRWIEPQDEVLGVVEKAAILALDIGQDGRLYFLSEGMGRVFVYDQNERFLNKFGEKGGKPGTLSRPRGIAVDDARQQVYLVDYQRHTMSVFAQNGEYLFEVGGLGAGRGWFYYPSDVVVDGGGRVIVADTFNHRLQVFEFISKKDVVDEVQPAESSLVTAEPMAGQHDEKPGDAKKIVHIRRLKNELKLEKTGDFLVLTAITRNILDAEQLERQLARKGYPVLIREIIRRRSGRWYQVLVGPFVKSLEAYWVAEKIRETEQLPTLLKTRGEKMDLEIPGRN